MTNEELKKKIVSIVRGAMVEADELPFIETTDNIADALIAAGIGDVNKFANMVASKIACHSYYYGDSIVSAIYVLKEGRKIKDVKPVNISEFIVDELRRQLKEAEHRAEVAERALEILNDYECISNPIRYYMKQAEKELAEEGEDD